jgi:hypothetical protein
MTCNGEGINPKSWQMSNMLSSFLYPFLVLFFVFVAFVCCLLCKIS